MKRTALRNNRGFTLAEILVAIGILSILMAVAIPNVISMRNDMKLIELDDTARQIFSVAQNRMVSLRSSGQTERLEGVEMTIKPTDFPDDKMEWDEEFYYVTNRTAGALLPHGSIDDTVRTGYYVIEYHKPSGMIYGVFYAKEPIEYNSGILRERGVRKSNFVGYYGGAGMDYAPAPSQTDSAQPEVVNEERLLLRLVAQGQTAYRVTVSGTQGEEAAYTFSFDYNSYELAAQNFPGQLSWHMEGGETIYELLLDGAPGEARFRDLFPELAPGADVEITVEATILSQEGESLPSVSRHRVNSLFAKAEEDGVQILWGRHLQNLEPGFSGVSGVTKAQLDDDIRWVYEEKFVPIVNEELTSFAGGNLIIRDLNIGRNGVYAGLFGRYQGEITGLRLVDARLDEPRADYAGLLIGLARPNTKVTGCKAYVEDWEHLDEYAVRGGAHAGGLIGLLQRGILDTCFASIPTVYAQGAAGGLVGAMEGGSLKNCYAATGYAQGDEYLGGAFAGGQAGGLVGRGAEGTISDCYAVGAVDGEGLVGSLLGEAAGTMSIERAYGAVLSLKSGLDLDLPFAAGAILNDCYMQGTQREEPLPEGLTVVAAGELAQLQMGAGWSFATQETTVPYTLEGNYPYPSLVSLPHYGDWPTELKSPKIEDPEVRSPEAENSEDLVDYEQYENDAVREVPKLSLF